MEKTIKNLLFSKGILMFTWTSLFDGYYNQIYNTWVPDSTTYLLKLPFFIKLAEIKIFSGSVELLIATRKYSRIKQVVDLAKGIALLNYEVSIWNDAFLTTEGKPRNTIIPRMLNPENSIPASNRRFRKEHPELFCEHGELKSCCMKYHSVSIDADKVRREKLWWMYGEKPDCIR